MSMNERINQHTAHICKTQSNCICLLLGAFPQHIHCKPRAKNNFIDYQRVTKTIQQSCQTLLGKYLPVLGNILHTIFWHGYCYSYQICLAWLLQQYDKIALHLCQFVQKRNICQYCSCKPVAPYMAASTKHIVAAINYE